ncbi:MAG: metal-sensitive transcriptional regulator [Candidatus Pacebacteria bacterium]|nr:metal-sensitive transcriptional regulator [Candidatus Paceibacterota bacterium]
MKTSLEDKKKISNRLRRAEGQIRGIEKLIDQDADMPKVLTQMKAVKSALRSVIWILLEKELSHEKDTDPKEQLADIKKNITQICKLLD